MTIRHALTYHAMKVLSMTTYEGEGIIAFPPGISTTYKNEEAISAKAILHVAFMARLKLQILLQMEAIPSLYDRAMA